MSHWLGVWAALRECLGCCPACAGVAFIAEGCVMVAPGAKGSFPSSTDDATKPKNIIALSNPHTRTTGFQGMRIRIAEPPRTKSGSRLPLLYCENPRLFVHIRLSRAHAQGTVEDLSNQILKRILRRECTREVHYGCGNKSAKYEEAG